MMWQVQQLAHPALLGSTPLEMALQHVQTVLLDHTPMQQDHRCTPIAKTALQGPTLLQQGLPIPVRASHVNQDTTPHPQAKPTARHVFLAITAMQPRQTPATHVLHVLLVSILPAMHLFHAWPAPMARLPS